MSDVYKRTYGGQKEKQHVTPQERDMLELLHEGNQEKEIAQQLRISLWTVSISIQNIYRKLDVHSRSQATRLAIQQRMIEGERHG